MNMKKLAKKEIINILRERHKFNLEYCKKRNWNINDLSFEKIMEIRSQEGWQNPKSKKG